MDEKKLEQLQELKKDRRKLIRKLREQVNALKSFEDVKLLLLALVSLQETQQLFEDWNEVEKQEAA